MVFASEEDECLVMDIGGTTTDMAILVREAPLLDPHGIDLGGFKTLIRSLNTFSVGLGGDSAVRLDQGQLTIGPQRREYCLSHLTWVRELVIGINDENQVYAVGIQSRMRGA